MTIHVTVLLAVKDTNALQLFERQAVKIMKKYEGKLVAAFEPDAALSSAAPLHKSDKTAISQP